MLRLASASALILCLASVACGDQQNQAASGAPSGAAPAKSGQAATPAKGGEPAILSELAKAKGCKLSPDEGFEDDCAAEKSLGEAIEKLAGEDEAKMKKVGESCVIALDDADASVRYLATSCLWDARDALSEAQKDALLTKLEADPSWAMREGLASAVVETNAKQGERVAGLLKKWKGDAKAKDTLKALFKSSPKNGEPAKDAFDVALELAATDADKGLASEAMRLLLKSKTRTAEACKKAAEVVTAKKPDWSDVAYLAIAAPDTCKADLDPLLDGVAALLGDPDGARKVELRDVQNISNAVKANATLTKEQKAKLAKGFEAYLKKVTDANAKTAAEAGLEAAKK